MKKLNFIIIFFLLLLQGLMAQGKEWTLFSSTIKFSIKNAGFMVNGSFKLLDAKIIFDKVNMNGNSVSATVDPNSISTGIGMRDSHLKKEEYFDTKQFSKITMKATLFSRERDGSFKGFFKVTIKNTTVDIPIAFTFVEKDNQGEFKSEFTLNRLDFNVGESSMILSDNVTVNLDVKVTKNKSGD